MNNFRKVNFLYILNMPIRLTTKEFIEKVKLKWNDKYDYSRVVYFNMKTKIEVVCKKNHIFLITPDNLLRGRGCPNCSGKINLVDSLNGFIEKSKKIHNNKYSYVKFKYINNKTKSIITCPEHGDFKQTTNLHLSGSGCRKCYEESLRSNLKSFIKMASKKHNSFYGYYNSKYKDSKSDIVITCPEHGDFKQKPSVHLSGSGCKKCMIDKFRISYKDFLDRASSIHNRIYTYKEESFVDMRTKIDIICPIHGLFKMTPDNHISKKRGCSSCSNNISKSEVNWLKSLGIGDKYRQFRIKIGDILFKVDAFDPNTNTIYEFYGDFWHGNPNIYLKEDINPVNKVSFGDLYKSTINRERLLKSYGYNIVSIWEDEYKNKITK
jgi:hypothetical protein